MFNKTKIWLDYIEFSFLKYNRNSRVRASENSLNEFKRFGRVFGRTDFILKQNFNQSKFHLNQSEFHALIEHLKSFQANLSKFVSIQIT
jgi:hypothetical protein